MGVRIHAVARIRGARGQTSHNVRTSDRDDSPRFPHGSGSRPRILGVWIYARSRDSMMAAVAQGNHAYSLAPRSSVVSRGNRETGETCPGNTAGIDHSRPSSRRTFDDRSDTNGHIGEQYDQYTLTQPPERYPDQASGEPSCHRHAAGSSVRSGGIVCVGSPVGRPDC